MNDEFFISQEELDAGARGDRGSNWQHWRRALKWLGFTILFGVIGVVAFVYFNISKISVNPFNFGSLKGESVGRVNIMMLGVGDPGHDGEQLSDTDIVMSIDTRNHQIAVISIPRDTRVDIPGYGKAKINTANEVGGIPMAKRVFESTLGIPIDYYVKANFTGLKEVVDAVGGVDVNNTTLLSDPEYPCDNNQYKVCGYRLAPGHYHLDGTQALKYVRCRKGTCGDDFGRAARQQEVMQQIRQRAASAGTLANPIALARLVSAAGNNVQTDLSITNMMRLEQLTKGIDKSHIYNIVFSLKPDGFLVSAPGSSDLLPADGTFAAIQNFAENIFQYGPIWSEHPTMVIENGTTTPGLGGHFSNTIAGSGYDITVSAVTNAQTPDHTTTEIIDYTGGQRPHTAAYLQGLLGVKQLTAPPAKVTTPPADLVVILGSDYAAKVAPQTQPSGGVSSSSSTSQ